MRRTKTLKPRPSAILTGDWHLREDKPVCRTDDFWQAQWDKVDQVAQLQTKYGCPVIHSGDLFGSKNPTMSWKPSPYLISTALLHLPDEFWTVYGNHDLPQHNIDLAEKAGVAVLANAGKLDVLKRCHWLEEPPIEDSVFPWEDRKMLVWHVMTWKGKNPIPGGRDPQAKQLLKKYPQFDIIITGHNHETFVEEYEGRLLVNPGSLTRQTANQTNHKPCVFLWYEKTNSVDQVFLEYEKGVVAREHIEKMEEVDARIAAFVDKLNTEWEAGVTFEENLERFRKENEVSQPVMEVIYKAMETPNGCR